MRDRHPGRIVGVSGVSACKVGGYADYPAPGPLWSPGTLRERDPPSHCADDGADLFGRVGPAIDMLASADKDSPACRRDAVAANKEARDAAPAVHRSGQETQEREVLNTPDARAARAGPQDQGMVSGESEMRTLAPVWGAHY